MDFLKKLFPMSFQKSSETGNLVKRIVIYAVAGILVAFILGLIAGFLYELPLVAGIFTLLGTLVGLYWNAGIVLAVLVHCNVIKVGDSNNNTEA